MQGGSAVSGASGSAYGGSVSNKADFIVNSYGASEYFCLYPCDCTHR